MDLIQNKTPKLGTIFQECIWKARLIR